MISLNAVRGEPRRLYMDDPPILDEWTYRVPDNGTVDLCTEHGLHVGCLDEGIRLLCRWGDWDRDKSRYPVEVVTIDVPVWRAGGFVIRNLEAEGDAAAQAYAASIRRWAATDFAQKVLAEAHDDAVSELEAA